MVSPHAPVSAADLRDPGGAVAVACDAFVMRFSRMQDILGARVFWHLVAVLEMRRPETTADVLARLEKDGILDKGQWFFLRGLRNNISHEYVDDLHRAAEAITAALAATPDLIGVFDRLHAHVVKHFPELRLGADLD